VVVHERVFLGGISRVHAALGSEQTLVFQPPRAAGAPALVPGERVTVHWRRDRARLLDA
jgi:hypothetical protein